MNQHPAMLANQITISMFKLLQFLDARQLINFTFTYSPFTISLSSLNYSLPSLLLTRSSPMRKIRIPMSLLEDSSSHNAKRVEEDRTVAIEAAIVRIMKVS